MKQDDVIASAIVKTCQQNAVRRSNAAFPQFRVDDGTPDSMLELLAQLDQATGKTSSGSR